MKPGRSNCVLLMWSCTLQATNDVWSVTVFLVLVEGHRYRAKFIMTPWPQMLHRIPSASQPFREGNVEVGWKKDSRNSRAKVHHVFT